MLKGAVIYAVESGLGRQAKQFFDHGIFSEILIQSHSHFTNHYEWYPDRVKTFDELLNKCKEIWFFETPFEWKYIIRAREKGVKTVLFAMYECTHNPLPYFPDVILGGSVMEKEVFGAKVLTVPVEMKWIKHSRTRVFIHNAGHLGLGGRNGTRELIDALKWVKSPIKMIIRSQVSITCNDPRVEVRVGDFPYETLFNEGDVFVYPDKFGGSCLPLQEAYASGMLVMASDRYPTNTWLPKEPLIPIKGYRKEKIFKEFNSAIVDPKDIAKTIDEWYDKDIEKYSFMGKKWGQDNSWKKLKYLYEAI